MKVETQERKILLINYPTNQQSLFLISRVKTCSVTYVYELDHFSCFHATMQNDVSETQNLRKINQMLTHQHRRWYVVTFVILILNEYLRYNIYTSS